MMLESVVLMNELLVWVIFKEVLHICERVLVMPQVRKLNESLTEGFVEGFLILSKFLYNGFKFWVCGRQFSLENHIATGGQELLVEEVV